MDSLWGELNSLEEGVRADLGALGARVAPLAALGQGVAAVRAKLGALDNLLQRGAVAAAALPTLADSARARARLETHRAEHGLLVRQLQSLRQELRINAERHAAAEKNQLLRRRKEDGEGAAVQTQLQSAGRATVKLREANEMMMREVQRMQAAREATDETSDLMRDAAMRHEELSGQLGIGQGLVTRLERREMTDRILIGFATAVFFLIVLYVLKQRMWG